MSKRHEKWEQGSWKKQEDDNNMRTYLRYMSHCLVATNKNVVAVTAVSYAAHCKVHVHLLQMPIASAVEGWRGLVQSPLNVILIFLFTSL